MIQLQMVQIWLVMITLVSAVANIGDLDGDGVNDLAAGATGVNAEPAGANRGAVHIMFMNTDRFNKINRRD